MPATCEVCGYSHPYWSDFRRTETGWRCWDRGACAKRSAKRAQESMFTGKQKVEQQ